MNGSNNNINNMNNENPIKEQRSRDHEIPTVNQNELRKNLTKPVIITPQEIKPSLVLPTKKIETQEECRTYACEKCKKCDEFEKTNNNTSICRNCGCELIFHLYGDEEMDMDDAKEWNEDDDQLDEEFLDEEFLDDEEEDT